MLSVYGGSQHIDWIAFPAAILWRRTRVGTECQSNLYNKNNIKTVKKANQSQIKNPGHRAPPRNQKK